MSAEKPNFLQRTLLREPPAGESYEEQQLREVKSATRGFQALAIVGAALALDRIKQGDFGNAIVPGIAAWQGIQGSREFGREYRELRQAKESTPLPPRELAFYTEPTPSDK